MTDKTITQESLQERLVAANFNKWLGLKILKIGEGTIEIALPWREEIMSNPRLKSTHGGVLAALIDATADFAIATKTGEPVPTIDMRVDYHRPATPGDLRAVGRIVRQGGTFTVAETEIFDGENRLVASGRGVYFTGAIKG
jgi:uncharacterized protein (TIGR00369 family)